MVAEAYQKILDLQASDLRIRQLTHLHADHDLRSSLAMAKHQAGKATQDVETVEGKLEDIAQQQRQLQHRIAELVSKREGSQAKLYGGVVTAVNELLALEEEVAGYTNKQDSFEVELLERMEDADGIQVELKEKLSTKVAVEEQVEEIELTLQKTLDQIDSDLEQEKVKRTEYASAADPELLKHYEELAPQFDGHAVAKLVHGGCDGCHIQLSVVALDQIAHLAEDAQVTCEECGRLLVR